MKINLWKYVKPAWSMSMIRIRLHATNRENSESVSSEIWLSPLNRHMKWAWLIQNSKQDNFTINLRKSVHVDMKSDLGTLWTVTKHVKVTPNIQLYPQSPYTFITEKVKIKICQTSRDSGEKRVTTMSLIRRKSEKGKAVVYTHTIYQSAVGT